MPSAFPRSFVGTAEVTMATLVPNIMAAPTPCRRRDPTSIAAERASAQRSDAIVNRTLPARKTRLRP